MGYVLYQPRYPLSLFVECLWSQIGMAPYTRDKILPTATIELMINLGPPHRVLQDDDSEHFDLHQDSWIAGMQNRFLVTEAVAETEMVGVRFKPGGAAPFFGFPMAEMSNQVVAMDAIWGRLVNEIQEQLYLIPDVHARLRLLELLLCQRLSNEIDDWRPMQAAVAALAQPNGPKTVRTLSADLGMSQKHLIAQFHKIIGLSPKALQRIFRFNQLLYAIDPQQLINWAALAVDHGYYDQAHLNKEFIAFAGMNPTTYIERRRQIFGPDLRRGEAVHFIPIA